MSTNWPTKEQDLRVARKIINEYASEKDAKEVGLFELIINGKGQKMEFKMARWVEALVLHFYKKYGVDQGDLIARRVISKYLIHHECIH